MTLRRRLTLVAGGAVAIAFVCAAVVVYAVVRGELRGQVDRQLERQADLIPVFDPATGDLLGVDPRRMRFDVPALPDRQGGPAALAQLIRPDGTVVGLRDAGVDVPVDRAALDLAQSDSGGSRLDDVEADGGRFRVLTIAVPGVGAVRLGRPLDEVDDVLGRLRLVLLLLCLAGAAAAAFLGRFAAARVLAPLHGVATAAEEIGETDDLTRRIAIESNDEVGQLARRFNTMLDRLQGSRAALDDSVRAQRQLVADASHELRTPITSLRTNLEVLAGGGVDGSERGRVMSDVVHQTEELGALVGDLIELARGDEHVVAREEVRLDQLVDEAIGRARRHFPDVSFALRRAPVVVPDAAPDRLGRAVDNLLANAAQHSPPDGAVDVAVDESGVTVRDRGAGFAAADLPHVFDRFYRGADAREGHVGSGLGLAIVRQAAESHGGTTLARNHPDGGAELVLTLNGEPV